MSPGSARRSRRRGRRRVPSHLRRIVLVSGLVAGVVSLTIGLTGLTGDRAPSRGGEGIAGEEQAEGDIREGIAAKVLDAADIGNGFARVQSGPQSIEDLASRLPSDLARTERDRLARLGFEEGALTIAYKAAVAPGPMTDTAVTVQILRFSTPQGARGQLDYDRQGGLAAGFGLSRPYSVDTDYKPEGWPEKEGPGVLLEKSPEEVAAVASTPESRPAAHVLVAAVVWESWEIAVEVRSSVPRSRREVDRLVTLQARRLGM